MIINVKKVKVKKSKKEDAPCEFKNKEFIVIDHPNVISKSFFEENKLFFEEVEEERDSFKGVF